MRNAFGRFLLWRWRKRAGVIRSEIATAPDLKQMALDAPPELVAVFDLGGGGTQRYTAVFDIVDSDKYLVLRLSTLPDHPTDGMTYFERVHKALLNIYEPHGRVEFTALPLAIQRHILYRLDEFTQPASRRRQA